MARRKFGEIKSVEQLRQCLRKDLDRYLAGASAGSLRDLQRILGTETVRSFAEVSGTGASGEVKKLQRALEKFSEFPRGIKRESLVEGFKAEQVFHPNVTAREYLEEAGLQKFAEDDDDDNDGDDDRDDSAERSKMLDYLSQAGMDSDALKDAPSEALAEMCRALSERADYREREKGFDEGDGDQPRDDDEKKVVETVKKFSEKKPHRLTPAEHLAAFRADRATNGTTADQYLGFTDGRGNRRQ